MTARSPKASGVDSAILPVYSSKLGSKTYQVSSMPAARKQAAS
jgi:hypothetical protein